MKQQGIRDRLRQHAHAYLEGVVVLCLNLPFLALVLARHLQGVGLASLEGVYAGLVFLGYYALIQLILVTAVYLVLGFWRRLAVAASTTLFVVALFYLTLNSFVHRIYRMHVDAFWLQYLLTSFSGIGIPRSVLAAAVLVVGGIVGLEWALFRIARRLEYRRSLAIGFVTATLVAFLASQAIHIVAYERNDTRITAITQQLPFYYPITSHKHAVRYGELMPLVGPAGHAAGKDAPASLRYPVEEVRCAPAARPLNVLMIVLESWRSDMMNPTVSPNLYAFSRRSTTFMDHFSTGNATPTGIFGLFYGIHPTYWSAVKSNSVAIDNPVMIDLLQANGYAFGIYADSHFNRHKIKDTIFRGITVHESFAGSTPDAKDHDLTERLGAWMDSCAAVDRPFFGFAFYKSTHYGYHYPPGAARFQPAQELNVATAGNRSDPTPYLNDYRNSIHYVDDLVGGLLRRLEESGILDRTVVVITSDHGEEFNDNHADYWGHCGNFTVYQTRVPMIVHVPGRAPRTVTARTAHLDVPPTVVEEALGCHPDPAVYSNGRNLLGALERQRPLVISSYVNHAFLMNDDVYVVFPMLVQKYRSTDINQPAAAPPPDQVKRVMEEMHRFYGGRDRPEEIVRAGVSPR